MAELLDFTKPHVLRNEAEYNAAVDEIDRLLDADPEPASEAYERLEFLSVLVQADEDTHSPLEELPTPQTVVAFMLDQKGLSRPDLAKWMGGKSRVSEFFQGVRPLSLRQIEALREQLGIPSDLLIRRAPDASDPGLQ
jgi:HTH-type transcriptional regulator/antitoxin HigA